MVSMGCYDEIKMCDVILTIYGMVLCTCHQGYTPTSDGPSEYQTIPLEKIEDFGVHCKRSVCVCGGGDGVRVCVEGCTMSVWVGFVCVLVGLFSK